ncbi:MAG: polysaccharide deacetylase family protein [Chitinophagales bacterium]
MYFVRTPYLVKKLLPGIIWELSANVPTIYLTFDDGPHPEITPWILEQLKKYNAKATFFCLGKNAEKYPEIVRQIIAEGHAVGSHGYHHLNGWKTDTETYLEDVMNAEKISKQIGYENTLFRPPYGKIKKSQISNLKSRIPDAQIINWSLMPGDFDETISSEQCCSNLMKQMKSGDIICLHDNEKARKHLTYCLPFWLDFIYNKGLKSDLLTL